MGMDVYGEAPKETKGEYFRNNCWWWRPLWDYVNECGLLTPEQHEGGHYNDGLLIPEEQALRIAATLTVKVERGEVMEVARRYKQGLDAMPDEVCDLCHGTGKRNDMVVAHGCNKCEGKGKVRPYETWYPFDEDNVKEFAEFCAVSGGFRIY